MTADDVFMGFVIVCLWWVVAVNLMIEFFSKSNYEKSNNRTADVSGDVSPVGSANVHCDGDYVTGTREHTVSSVFDTFDRQFTD